MSEAEIKEAIASQEEHIKRVTTCQGKPFYAHNWAPGAGAWIECARCGVTKTPADYAIKSSLRAQWNA